MPTWIHGLLQAILCRLLWQAGYKSGSEVELRIDPNFCPKPDVIATRGRIEAPYPTRAVEVVIEILSREDSMALVLEKWICTRCGDFIRRRSRPQNPGRVISGAARGLELTDTLAAIPADQIWSAFDAEFA